MLCGWITTRICSGARSNSQRASMTSSALFIIVAESTEILRPITQFGCAQACVGRHVAQRRRVAAAERPARGGEHDVVDARGPGAAVLGQALEDRRMLAVDRQQRGAALAHRLHEQRAADDQRLLVGQQQALAGARRGQAGRQPGGADDGRHHRVDLRMRGQLAQRRGAGQHLGAHARPAQALAQRARLRRRRARPRSAGCQRRHCARSSSTRLCAVSAKTSKRSGWRAITSSVLDADRAGRAEDADAQRAGGDCVITSQARPAPARAERPAARHRRGRARRRGRAAGRCCPWRRRCA